MSPAAPGRSASEPAYFWSRGPLGSADDGRFFRTSLPDVRGQDGASSYDGAARLRLVPVGARIALRCSNMPQTSFAAAISVVLVLLPAAASAETVMSSGPSQPAGKNLLWNGTFDGASARPWSVGLESPDTGRWAITNQELCVRIDRARARPLERRDPAAAADDRARAPLSAEAARARHGPHPAAGPARQDQRSVRGALGRHRRRRIRAARRRGELRRARSTTTTSSWPSSSEVRWPAPRR